MNFWLLLLIAHLFLTAYTIFFLWKEDVVFEGDTVNRLYQMWAKEMSRSGVVCFMIFLCVCPILNLVLLLTQLAGEFEDIRILHRETIRHFYA